MQRMWPCPSSRWDSSEHLAPGPSLFRPYAGHFIDAVGPCLQKLLNPAHQTSPTPARLRVTCVGDGGSEGLTMAEGVLSGCQDCATAASFQGAGSAQSCSICLWAAHCLSSGQTSFYLRVSIRDPGV